MSDPFQPVRAGDPLAISARFYNATLEAINRTRDTRLGEGSPEGGWNDTGIVTIKNASGADVSRFGVLGIDGILFSPSDNLDGFKHEPILSGITPTEDTHAGKFAVTLEPIAIGAVGRAVVSGATVVQISVSDADHLWADVKNTDTSALQSADSGVARILYKESGTGLKWAVVRIGGGGASASIPVGQYQYMVYQVVASNVNGFDLTRASPTL